MRALKIVICVQAIALLYLFRENGIMKEHIIESADAVSKSTKKIENQSSELSLARQKLGECKYELGKTQDQLAETERHF